MDVQHCLLPTTHRHLTLPIYQLSTQYRPASSRAHTTIIEANECGYLSEQLLYLIHSRLDLQDIKYFQCHWMSVMVYAIAFSGPLTAIAAPVIIALGISIDCGGIRT